MAAVAGPRGRQRAYPGAAADGGQTLFRASDDLEGVIARRGLVARDRKLASNRRQAMTHDSFLARTAL